MDDVRWFAPNHYCALPVPALGRAGLQIALEGDDDVALAREIESLLSLPPSRPTALPPQLSDLSIEVCAARLLQHLRRIAEAA